MKRVFSCVLIAVAVAACGRVDAPLYFDNANFRVTNTPTEQMDTLSYALGMNFGIGAKSQSEGFTFDFECLTSAMEQELAKGYVDNEFYAENKKLMKRFGDERLRPYAISSHRKLFINKDEDNSAVKSPTIPLYNKEFTKEKVSMMYGYDLASYIVKMAYPINLYWFNKGVNEAYELDSQIILDDMLGLNVMQMRGAMQKYGMFEYPKFIKEASQEWLAKVAKQRNVEPMVVEDDTLYYRVNVKGNSRKPRSLNDTVSLSYALYSRSGMLVESLAQREAMILEALEGEKMADTLKKPDANRVMRIRELEQMLDDVQNLRIPVSKSLLKGMQYAMQTIGEGGDVTVWMPASLAFGAQGNKVVAPNDAVVMNISLKSVAYGE